MLEKQPILLYTTEGRIKAEDRDIFTNTVKDMWDVWTDGEYDHIVETTIPQSTVTYYYLMFDGVTLATLTLYDQSLTIDPTPVIEYTYQSHIGIYMDYLQSPRPIDTDVAALDNMFSMFNLPYTTDEDDED